MTSPRRPVTPPNPAILDDHRHLIRALERRGLIRGSISLGALSMLTGCDVNTTSIEDGLRLMSSWNSLVQAAIFDPNKLAPAFPASKVLKPPKFNAYYDITALKPVDARTWRLELSGLIADRRAWTAERRATLPETEIIIKHICVEGWDYIGEWAGPMLRSFLERVGADTRARYVAFKTADDYPSIIDMPTALHPQTLLATKYACETLADPFGFPLRLRTATKLGFKDAKWITAIEVTNTYAPGYWEKSGENWFSGE